MKNGGNPSPGGIPYSTVAAAFGTGTLGLERLTGRCTHGFAAVHHPAFCGCRDLGEWTVFVTALRNAVSADRLIHQRDVRPAIRGRIEPKHIGQLWRRARSEGLVRDTGRREPSDDVAGRNADKLDRIYEWAAAPLADTG